VPRRSPYPKGPPPSRIIVAVQEELQRRRVTVADFMRQADRDRNDALTTGELETALESVGLRLERGEIREIFRHLDLDRNGRVGYDELTRVLLGGGGGSPLGSRNGRGSPAFSVNQLQPDGNRAPSPPRCGGGFELAPYQESPRDTRGDGGEARRSRSRKPGLPQAAKGGQSIDQIRKGIYQDHANKRNPSPGRIVPSPRTIMPAPSRQEFTNEREWNFN